MLTPGKGRGVHNLQGTIYERVVDSGDANIVYHCHAAPTKEAKRINPVWTIWREDLTTGVLTNPVNMVTGEPKPDNNRCDELKFLTYWETFDPLVLISNSSGDPITNSDNDQIFT